MRPHRPFLRIGSSADGLNLAVGWALPTNCSTFDLPMTGGRCPPYGVLTGYSQRATSVIARRVISCPPLRTMRKYWPGKSDSGRTNA